MSIWWFLHLHFTLLNCEYMETYFWHHHLRCPCCSLSDGATYTFTTFDFFLSSSKPCDSLLFPTLDLFLFLAFQNEYVAFPTLGGIDTGCKCESLVIMYKCILLSHFWLSLIHFNTKLYKYGTRYSLVSAKISNCFWCYWIPLRKTIFFSLRIWK